MSERKEIEELVKKTEGNSDNPSGVLQSYKDYAELCSDPTEVYQYMEDKQICVAIPSFWRQRAKLLCSIGSFREAVVLLEKSTVKCQSSCSTPEEASKFKCSIQQGLGEIEGELVRMLLAKAPRKRTVEEFKAMHEEESDSPRKIGNLVVMDAQAEHKHTSRLHRLLEVCEKECLEEIEQRKQEFAKSRKDKPLCSLRTNFQKGTAEKGAPLQRTHSILHRSAFDFSNFKPNRADNCLSPKSGIKFERNQTLDSIEILKKKKTLPKPPTVEADEEDAVDDELQYQTRLYRTMSYLDQKRVHFGTSVPRNKNTAGPKIEKVRSLNVASSDRSPLKAKTEREQQELPRQISSETEECPDAQERPAAKPEAKDASKDE